MYAVVRIIRPFTLLPPMLGMLTGALAALGRNSSATWNSGVWGQIAMGMVMAGVLNGASNVLNQVCDLEQDRINKPHRPIPAGDLSIRFANCLAVFLYVLANVLAYFIDSGAGHECFYIVLFTSFLTYAYSGPPFRWRRFGWRANLTVALPRGLLLKVAGWSTVAPVFSDSEPWFLGGVFFLFLLGATTTKDYADVVGDRAAGVNNLPIRLGVEGALKATAPFFVLPWIFLAASPWLPGTPLHANPWGLLTLGTICTAYGVFIVRVLFRDPNAIAKEENHPAWGHMYKLMMLAQVGSALVYHLSS